MCLRVTYNNPWLLVTSLIKLLYHEDPSFLGVVLCGMEGHEQLQGKGSTGSRQSFYSPSFVWRGVIGGVFFSKELVLVIWLGVLMIVYPFHCISLTSVDIWSYVDYSEYTHIIWCIILPCYYTITPLKIQPLKNGIVKSTFLFGAR